MIKQLTHDKQSKNRKTRHIKAHIEYKKDKQKNEKNPNQLNLAEYYVRPDQELQFWTAITIE